MAEWGIPFDHIETHWTDRQYVAHVNALAERMERTRKAQEKSKAPNRERVADL